MHVTTAQVFGRDDLTNRGLDQRRATQKNRALVFDDDGFVAHGGHISAAGGARPHDDGDLRDALRAHVGLVVKNTTEMIAIRKHIVLVRQVGAA